MVAGQKIALVRVHAGQTVTVHLAATQMAIDFGGGDTRLSEGPEGTSLASTDAFTGSTLGRPSDRRQTQAGEDQSQGWP